LNPESKTIRCLELEPEPEPGFEPLQWASRWVSVTGPRFHLKMVK